jgi:signal transduction histidine kinase
VAWEIAPEIPNVRTDPDLVRMILNNLFSNAVTYADPGGAVRVSASSSGSRVELVISNSGSRVSPEDAKHVFDRFWRGDAARTEAGVRCGLGLSLCRKLVEVLGGEIAATSRDGTFNVTVALPTEVPVARI